MEEAPRTFVRRLSQQVELSPVTCRNIFKKDIHLYPYRLQEQFFEELHDNEIVDGFYQKMVPLHTDMRF
ncbi:hypothetical protein BDFB_006677 [Asbolus verrucosus]|uniref:Uncharacterized protein n=1 Tax=Asbolus verrucosus TaxID=1661398 RepID=A0A482VLQ6_ASBVE|nr:hypothetical protein BDFB_006677 [Asbolus verrucosus]